MSQGFNYVLKVKKGLGKGIMFYLYSSTRSYFVDTASGTNQIREHFVVVT